MEHRSLEQYSALPAAGRWCLVQAAGALAPLDGLAVPQYSFPCAASAWSGGALPPESGAGRRLGRGRRWEGGANGLGRGLGGAETGRERIPIFAFVAGLFFC